MKRVLIVFVVFWSQCVFIDCKFCQCGCFWKCLLSTNWPVACLHDVVISCSVTYLYWYVCCSDRKFAVWIIELIYLMCILQMITQRSLLKHVSKQLHCPIIVWQVLAANAKCLLQIFVCWKNWII